MLKFLFKWGKRGAPEENLVATKNLESTYSITTSTPVSESPVVPGHFQSSASASDLSAENDLLLDTIMGIQESLEEGLLKQEQLVVQLHAIQASDHQIVEQKERLAVELLRCQSKVAELELTNKTTSEQFAHAEQDLQELRNHHKQLQDSLDATHELEKKVLELSQEKDLLIAEKSALLEKSGSTNIHEEDFKARLEDFQDENFALVGNLNQIQEELEQHFLQKQRVQQEYNTLQSRWKRIERNYPYLMDYDDIRLITVDSVSATPYLVWEARNFYHANVIYPKFNMVTLLSEGRGGMAVLDPDVLGDKKAASRSLSKNIVFPHLLFNPFLIAQNYKLLGSIPWKRTLSGVAMLEEILQKIWPKSQFPKDMDPSFWRSSLTQLLLDLKQLPKIITFEKVTLKRELRNIDYEHVWLEVHNLQFGNAYFIPKFEMRVGASLIQSPGFSRHPKFEFPLINGRVKPFETWYAESSDENGSKFELRFDLNKQVADFNALSKLSRPDLIFLVNVILSVPQFIQALEDDLVPVTRTWAPWKSLVEEANVLVAQILQSLAVAGAKTEPQQTSSAKLSGLNDAVVERPKSIETEKKPLTPLKVSKSTSQAKKKASNIKVRPSKKTAAKSSAKSAAKTSAKLVTKKVIKKK